MNKYINMDFNELCELGDKELREIETRIINIFDEIMDGDYLEIIYKEYIEMLEELYTKIDYIMSSR